MTLRKKTILIVGSTFIGLLIFLSMVSWLILIGSFEKLEEKYANLNIERVTATLQEDIANINRSANDWAVWDETYAFIETKNNNFVKANLADSAFTLLRLNLILFFDNSGRLVFGKAFDLANMAQMPIPESLLSHLKKNNLLLRNQQDKNGLSGIMLLPENPVLIASHPIMTSEGKGPVRGTLMFGRFLDSAEIARLAGVVRLNIKLYRFDEVPLPEDLKTAASFLSKEKPSLIRPLNYKTLEGYAMLPDVYGNPGIILKFVSVRTIYQEGRDVYYYFFLSFLLIGLVLGAVTLVLLDEQVLSRISELIRNIGIISVSKDLSMRVPIKGRDEITLLSEEMNAMLGVIEKSDSALRTSEEKYRLIVEHASEAIVIAQDGKLMYTNPKTAEITGYAAEELVGQAFIKFVHPDDHALVTERYRKRIMGEEVPSVYSFRILDKLGSIKWVEINAVRTSWEGKEATLNFISDITDRKGLEEELRSLSLRDALTGLYNRRGFITLAEQQLKIANRMQKGMILIFVDLDDLKQINDNLGHYEGDRALMDIAEVMQKTFREADILARYGGDEFVALTIETPESGVELFLSRLSEQLEDYNRSGNRPFTLSISTGFSRYKPGEPVNLNDLLIEADQIMYKCKKAKRNYSGE